MLNIWKISFVLDNELTLEQDYLHIFISKKIISYYFYYYYSKLGKIYFFIQDVCGSFK